MKKKLATLFMALSATMTLTADPEIILLEPTTFPNESQGGPQRTPILVPVLYLDGYTLSAGNGTLGSTIQILDEDGNVVFSTYIYVEGDIELPATLTGTYTIEVIRGSQTFVGEITL